MSGMLFDEPEDKASISALAPWFGGKRTLATTITAELGRHSCYWEPFCGSMAVLLSKRECQSETVNDLNADLINLARVVASDDAVKLFDRLSRTFVAEQFVIESNEKLKTEGMNSLDRAYWYFVQSWMGRNGIAGTLKGNTSFCVRYTSNGGDPAVRFRSAVASIPAWAARLAGVTILSRDGLELLSRIEDKPGTAIYCDPPYLEKGARYLHDFNDQQHGQLAELLQRFNKTRVLVSYYEHPKLRSLYPGWTFAPLKATKAMVNQGMRDKSGVTEAPEVLIINGPSNA